MTIAVFAASLVVVVVLALIARDIAIRALADRADARVQRSTEAERLARECAADIKDLRTKVSEVRAAVHARVRK